MSGTAEDRLSRETMIRMVRDADNPYFTALRAPFNDQRLSWEARGVLAYLSSKPRDWRVSFYDLCVQGGDGRDKTRSILRELTLNGYLRRRRVQNAEGGTFGWEALVYESPCDDHEIAPGPWLVVLRCGEYYNVTTASCPAEALDAVRPGNPFDVACAHAVEFASASVAAERAAALVAELRRVRRFGGHSDWLWLKSREVEWLCAVIGDSPPRTGEPSMVAPPVAEPTAARPPINMKNRVPTPDQTGGQENKERPSPALPAGGADAAPGGAGAGKNKGRPKRSIPPEMLDDHRAMMGHVAKVLTMSKNFRGAQAAAALRLLDMTAEAGRPPGDLLACFDDLRKQKWRKSFQGWLTVEREFGGWAASNRPLATAGGDWRGRVDAVLQEFETGKYAADGECVARIATIRAEIPALDYQAFRQRLFVLDLPDDVIQRARVATA